MIYIATTEFKGIMVEHSIIFFPLVTQSVKNPPVMQKTRVQSELGRSTGEVNGNPLLYSCLRKPMDRGAWWATVHRAAKESDIA